MCKIKKITLELKIKEDNFKEKTCFFTLFTNNYFEGATENQGFWEFLKIRNANNQIIYVNHDDFESKCDKYIIFTILPTIIFFQYNKIILSHSDNLKTKVRK